MQPRAVLAHAVLVGQSLDDAVEAGRVDAEPLAELADCDSGMLADERQHVLLSLARARARGPRLAGGPYAARLGRRFRGALAGRRALGLPFRGRACGALAR